MPEFSLSNIDLGIIILYFVVVLAIGFWVAGRTKSGEDLFLAGRSLLWPAIGLSLFASNISSASLIGMSGAAYEWGIAVSNYEWMAAIILVVFVIFFVPPYIKSRISTVPEFLEKRFSRSVRLYFSALTIFANIVIDTAGSLYAGAMVLQLFFPQFSLLASCLILALVAGLYTAAGGLAAVVYTDMIQAVVLLVGSSVLAIIAFGELDYSWATVVEQTPPQMLSLMLPADDPHLPWVGTLIGVPVLGFYFWCTNQFIVQRVLGAKSVEHARWGSLLGGLLKLTVLFIMILPGTMARILFPDLTESDMVFPTMVMKLLPVGAVGIVLAGLIAAIMSSIDSTLNSASALVTLDFIKPRRPDMTPEQTAKVGRIAIIVIMVLGAVIGPVIGEFPGLFNYLQYALSFLVPPVVALFLVGMFWKRANASGAMATLIGGHSISAILFVLGVTDVFDLHFSIVAGLLFFVSCGIFVLASLVGEPPPAEKVDAFTYSAENIRDDSQPAWYADYRTHCVILLALTALLVIAFW